MNYKDKYNEWLAFADENTKAELESITDEKDIQSIVSQIYETVFEN